MPFNVCDGNGEHIGVVYSRYPLDSHNRKYVLIALTDLAVDAANLKMDLMRDYIAFGYECKSIFGKIKEEKLTKTLKQLWEQEYHTLGEFNEDFFIKLLFMKRYLDIHECLDFDQSQIKAFVLFDVENVLFQDHETIILNDSLDYIIEMEGVDDLVPIYFKVMDLPLVEVRVMSTGEGLLTGANITDFGGMNHVHQTKLKLLSGNALCSLSFPVSIYAKKGMTIAMYFNDRGKILIVCDGVIYRIPN